MSYSPSSYDFPATAVSSGSNNFSFTLTNTSDLPVFINSFSSLAGSFDITSDTCPASPAALSSEASCQVNFTFAPTTGGGHSATVSINYGLVAGLFPFNSIAGLTGVGVSPLVFAGIDSIDSESTTTLTLNWTNNADATSYYIFDTSSGSSVFVSSVIAGSSSFQVTGLDPNTSYSYQVNGVDVFGGLDSNSNVVTGSTDGIGSFSVISDFTGAENTTFTSASLVCTDADSSVPSYSITNQTDASINCSISGSDISCTPTYKTGHSPWSSIVSVGCLINGTSLTKTVTVTATDTNRPPSLDSISNETIVALNSITPIDAGDGADDSDIDLDVITYSCTVLGDSVSPFTSATDCNTGSAPVINTTTGQITWTTILTHAQANTEVYTITVTADDGTLTDTESFVITVTSPTPILNTFANLSFLTTEGVVGTPISMDFNNTRDGGSSDAGMTYTCNFQMGWPVGSMLSCDDFPNLNPLSSSDGVLSFTPTSAHIGAYRVIVTGTNSAASDSVSLYMVIRSAYPETNILGAWDPQFGNYNRIAETGDTFVHDLANSNDFVISGSSNLTVAGSAAIGDPGRYIHDNTGDSFSLYNEFNSTSGSASGIWVNFDSLPADRLPFLGFGVARNFNGLEISVSENNPGIISSYVGAENYQDFVQLDNPIAFWLLDETSGTTLADSSTSGNNHVATMNAEVGLNQVAGIYSQLNRGKSIGFVDASLNYATASNDSDFEMGSLVSGNHRDHGFSIDTWMYLDSGNSNGSGIFSFGDNYSIHIFGGDLIFQLQDADAGASTFQSIKVAAADLAFDQWAHYAFTYNGQGYSDAHQGLKVYIDGVEVTTVFHADAGTYVAMDTDNTNTFNIGVSSGGSRFTGQLDNVAVYDYMLTAGQVNSHYKRGEGIRYPNYLLANKPAGFWRLGESQGTIAYDVSGNNRHGTYSSINLGAYGSLGGKSNPDTDTAVYSNAESQNFSVPLGDTSFLDNATQASLVAHMDADWGSSINHLRMDSSGNVFGIKYSAGSVIFSVAGATTGTSTIAGVDATWHQYALIYDGSKSTDETKLRTFIDGIEVFGTYAGTVPTALGVFDTKFRYYSEATFSGTADEIGLFDYALNEVQVLNMFNDSPFHYCIAPKAAIAGDWNHIAASYGETSRVLSLVVNGDKKCEIELTANLDGNTSIYTVGGTPGQFGSLLQYQTFDGTLPITGTQLESLYDQDAYRYGKSASSVLFDQSFVLSAAGSNPPIFDSISATEAFSFSFWLNSNNLYNTLYIFGNNDGAGETIELRADSAGFLQYRIMIGGSSIWVSGTAIPINVSDGWAHVAITKDTSGLAAGVKIYINGVEETLSVLLNNLTGTGSPGDFFLGTQQSGAGSRYKGHIDNFAIFDAELSSAQVTSIYNSGTPKSLLGHANIVNWWPLGDGDSFPTIFDRVGSSDLTFSAGDASDIVRDYPE
jgi:hypothetical protein